MGHGEFNGAVSELPGIAFDDSNMSSSANPVWSVNAANDDDFVRWGRDDAIPDGETLYVAPHYTVPDGQVLFATDATHASVTGMNHLFWDNAIEPAGGLGIEESSRANVHQVEWTDATPFDTHNAPQIVQFSDGLLI